MTYTAKIISKKFQRNVGRVEIIVEILDGTEVVMTKPMYMGYDITMEKLKHNIKSIIEKMELTDEALPHIIEGDVDLTGVVVDKTINEQKFDAWRQDLTRLHGVDKLIELGILTGNEPRIVEIKERLKKDFDPSYLLRF